MKTKTITLIAISMAVALFIGIGAGYLLFSGKQTSAQKEESAVIPAIEQPGETEGAIFPLEKEQETLPAEPEKEDLQQTAEEWCAPTEINYIIDPYVSVHSPKIIFIENSAKAKTPIVATLELEDKYRMPITGKILTLTKLGVPEKHKVTALEFQTRATHSGGNVIYSDVFKVEETFDLQYITIHNVIDSYTINTEGILKLESKLQYKIGGVERVQCTPANSVPFASGDSYLLPAFTNVQINQATSYTGQGSENLNAMANVIFDYTGIKPISAEFRTISAINPANKVYFTGTGLKCEDGKCSAELSGFIDTGRRQLLCSTNALHYLQVSIGNAQKNAIIELDANSFLKEFGGCPA